MFNETNRFCVQSSQNSNLKMYSKKTLERHHRPRAAAAVDQPDGGAGRGQLSGAQEGKRGRAGREGGPHGRAHHSRHPRAEDFRR